MAPYLLQVIRVYSCQSMFHFYAVFRHDVAVEVSDPPFLQVGVQHVDVDYLESLFHYVVVLDGGLHSLSYLERHIPVHQYDDNDHHQHSEHTYEDVWDRVFLVVAVYSHCLLVSPLQLSVALHLRQFLVEQFDEHPVATAESHSSLWYVDFRQLHVGDVVFLHHHSQSRLAAHHVLVVAGGNAEQSLFHGAVHHLFGFDKISRPHHLRTVVALLEYHDVIGFQILEAPYRCGPLGVCNHHLVSGQFCLGVIYARDWVCGSSNNQVGRISVESLVGFCSGCHVDAVGDVQVG